MRIIRNNKILILAVLIMGSLCYQIIILTDEGQIAVTGQNGTIKQNFTDNSPHLSCLMPELYVLNNTFQKSYQLQSEGILIKQIKGKHHQIQYQVECIQQDQLNRCLAEFTLGCQGSGKNQMNWITVYLQSKQKENSQFQFLVNCYPDQFYKPFEWGLFILICFCTITITLSSFYSSAWSYAGFGISVNKTFVIVFNAILVLGSVLAFFTPNFTSIFLKIIGSLIGVIGVAVCTSQTLWLTKSRFILSACFGPVRRIDIISFTFGIISVAIYWLTNGMWIINDFLAICTTVTCIKIFKIRSLKLGVFMLFSLLVIQIIAGLVVHYALKISYNNLVIKTFQSPLVFVFPSITPQFYRKCAWIPVTNIIFPGLFISYLRRFDKSRGTFLYLLIGYGSFYIGSILWMIVDMQTRHSLPMAIISDPITILIICFFSMRRNQLKTIWGGLFYDIEMPDISQDILPKSRDSNYIAFQQITEDLKIDKNRDSQISDKMQKSRRQI